MDYRLYFITADYTDIGRSHTTAALAAAKGGATVIQFRDKEMNDYEFRVTALAIKKITGEYGIPLVINDRAAIAAEIGADGVHIGQGDLDAKSVREIVGRDVAIGCSVSSLAEALQAEADGADYLGAGPIFPTGSKADAAAPIGLADLEIICGTVDIPVVAIGGISMDNIDEIKRAGAAGAAVISAVAGAPDMEQAAAELLKKWETK